MNWTRKDWLDLMWMSLGAVLGVSIIGLGIAPLLGIEFIGNKPTNYMLVAVAGTLCGYLLRFSISHLRSKT